MSKKLFKATSLVSLMTFISRILGFIRDALVAQIYGASGSVDAFYVAFKIPNFMRALFAEGCFSQAFVPVLSEYRQQQPLPEVRQFVAKVAGSLGSVLIILTVLGVIGAPNLVKLFAPGYYPGTERFIWATQMLRLTFPYLLLISFTALAGAVLNSYGRFGAPAFTPTLLNVCMIIAAIGFSHHFQLPVMAQAVAVLIAGMVQLVFLWPFLFQTGLLVRPRWGWTDPGVRRVMRLMVPALFGASVGQLSLLLNTIFASFLTVGSVSWLYYSDRLAYFPLGVFGVALATVVLPHLSANHAAKSPQAFAATLDWGIRCNLLIGMPAMVALMVLAGPLIVSLFHYGQFTQHDVMMTRQSVLAYAIGLPAFMLVKVLSAGFYARQDVKTPVKIGVLSMLTNMGLNAGLVLPLAHAGLALAASLASWVNTGLLLKSLYRQQIYRFQAGWGLFAARLVLANGVMALAFVYCAGPLTQWLHWHWQQRLLHVVVLGMIGLAVYVSSLVLFGLRWQDLRSHR